MNKLKVVLLGYGAVGKSALTQRFVNGSFMQNLDPTVEDVYQKEVKVKNHLEVLDILDTAALESFISMIDLYIRNGEGFMLVYSITSKQSFLDIQHMRSKIQKIKGVSFVPMILVGNKCDLDSHREVSFDDGEKLSKEWDVPFYETSAKTYENVETVFIAIANEILKTR